MYIEQFFEYAKERYRVQQLKESGAPMPWTDDPIIAGYRFCNIFREDDRTTVWFRENVRNVLRGEPLLVAKATAGFRLFNRIETGERIKNILLTHGWNGPMVRKALKNQHPLVTGAYMVRTPYGVNKLEGAIVMMKTLLDSKALHKIAARNMSLEEAHCLIEAVPWQGHFTAYEIVTDLRHTVCLEKAPDIMTWANPGPGAQRGLKWVFPEEAKRPVPRNRQIYLMRELLRLSQPAAGYWPEDWPEWEMREVEHTLCEFDKYRRGQNGKPLKRRYYGGRTS